MINFIQKSIDQCPIDLYANLKIITPQTKQLIDICFDHGGYVAGGFALLALRDYECLTLDRIDDRIARTVGDINEHMWCGADIDVWFSNALQLSKFENDLRTIAILNSGTCSCEETISNCANEYTIINGSRTQRVQVIKKFLNPVIDQLATFDIYNSMVAFDRTKFIYAENLLEFERNLTIHVVDWSSPYTIKRLLKYMSRKGYTKTTPETASVIAKEALSAIEWAKKNNAFNIPDKELEKIAGFNLLKISGSDPEYLIYKIKKLLPSMSNDDLLLLSGIFGKGLNQYDFAMQTIKKRSNFE